MYVGAGMLDSAPICHSCNKPLRDGNPRWSSGGRKDIWHYHCATEAGLTQESRRIELQPDRDPLRNARGEDQKL